MKLNLIILFLILDLTACNRSLDSKNIKTVDITNQDFSAIVGGEEVLEPKGLAKHVVLIYGSAPSGNYICTGSLISPTHILTAAHCVKKGVEKIRIIFKQNLATGKTDTSLIREVDETVIYPDYNYDSKDGVDLAVLKMSAAAPRPFEPINLPSQYFQTLSSKIEVISYGFGRITGRMKQDESDSQGQGLLRSVKLKVEDYHPELNEFLVDQKSGKGICNGDSGGPSFYKKGYENFILGVHSKIRYEVGNPDVCSFRGVITNVTIHSDWIKKSMQTLQ